MLMLHPHRIQAQTKTQAQIQRQWVEHYALSYPIENKSWGLYCATRWLISKNWAEATQWVLYENSGCRRVENHKLALRTCRNESSGFANYFSRQWCAMHGRSKQNALPVWKIFLQTFEFARFRNWGQMGNNWPNHKINGYRGSPKSLIQADDGQNSW